MKQVQVPPPWQSILNRDSDHLGRVISTDGVQEVISRAQAKYLHWDELRHRPMPAAIDPSTIWALVKVARFAQSRSLPLLSITGQPFGFTLPDCVIRGLHEIDKRATGSILVDEVSFSKRDRDRYVVSSLMEESIASSILEGAATTRKVAKDLLRTGRTPTSRGEQMILNNYTTMQAIRSLMSEPLSPELLCHIQAEITRNTFDDATASGRFRRSDEHVVVQDMTDGTTLHDPPHADNLPSRLSRLCSFANAEDGHPYIHPVVKASLLHFLMGYEHPFVDGNGRTARAVFYWYLLKHNYGLLEYLPISRIILKAPSRYKRAFLYSENDDYDLTYFIVFSVRALMLAIDDLKRYIQRKQADIHASQNLLQKLRGLNHRQKELIRHALNHPEADYTFVGHATTHAVTYQTARTDLFRLEKRGLLRKAKEGRTWHFSPHPKLPEKLAITDSHARTP